MLQDLKTVINGEHLLLGGTPPEWEGRPIGPAFFYKRRYTWDAEHEMHGGFRSFSLPARLLHAA